MMPWSSDAAMRQMWSEMDRGVSNGEMMLFFKRHLELAFAAGRTSATKAPNPKDTHHAPPRLPPPVRSA